MGRHSASDDDEDETLDVLALDDPATISGRHLRIDDPPAAPTAAGTDAVVDVPARTGRGNQSTASDLALLREHAAVRSRVVAAVVAPFVLYTAVLLLIGALGVYLIWVWIPLVTAGVVAGSILDVEHRRRAHAADR